MATLHGRIFDATSDAPVAAKVHILDSTGHFRSPQNHVLKVGPGRPFFYCEYHFEVNLPRGSADILVERGTEYEPLLKTVYIPSNGHLDLELPLKRWADLPSLNWYPGNTHIHYDEKEYIDLTTRKPIKDLIYNNKDKEILNLFIKIHRKK